MYRKDHLRHVGGLMYEIKTLAMIRSLQIIFQVTNLTIDISK